MEGRGFVVAEGAVVPELLPLICRLYGMVAKLSQEGGKVQLFGSVVWVMMRLDQQRQNCWSLV